VSASARALLFCSIFIFHVITWLRLPASVKGSCLDLLVFDFGVVLCSLACVHGVFDEMLVKLCQLFCLSVIVCRVKPVLILSYRIKKLEVL
jgi:hypothetical protein